MYVPDRFSIPDRQIQLDLIRENGWGQVVSVKGDVPIASHLPFVVEGHSGEERLAFHLARANPQWETFSAAREVLVIFQGPHTYVTPTWCEAERALPTWSYAAVHVYGRPRIVDDPRQKREMQQRLVAHYESSFAAPWTMDHLAEDWVDGMLAGVVSFEIPIARTEAIFRLLQNRPAGDRHKIAGQLARAPDTGANKVAELMRRHSLTEAD